MMLHHSHSELSAQWSRDIAQAKADPVFAAIERWRVLWGAHMAACAIEDGEACDAAAALTSGPAYAALGEVYRTPPTTRAGLLAVMAVMLEADGDHLDLIGPQSDQADDATRGLIAVFHHARRLLETEQ
jgi:hypothetical protein